MITGLSRRRVSIVWRCTWSRSRHLRRQMMSFATVTSHWKVNWSKLISDLARWRCQRLKMLTSKGTLIKAHSCRKMHRRSKMQSNRNVRNASSWMSWSRSRISCMENSLISKQRRRVSDILARLSKKVKLDYLKFFRRVHLTKFWGKRLTTSSWWPRFSIRLYFREMRLTERCRS